MSPRSGKQTPLSWIKHICCGVCWIAFGIVATVVPLNADIYMYIDSEGVLHFSNVPTSSNYRIYIKERPLKSLLNSSSPDRYDHFIEKAAKKHGISFPLLKSVVKVESEFNPRAVSKSGALGLMQIMPENIRSLNIKDPFDPWENIMGGARYLKEMLKRFDGKVPLALAAYNAGPNLVEHYNSIPPIKETEDFVKKVMKYYYVFKK